MNFKNGIHAEVMLIGILQYIGLWPIPSSCITYVSNHGQQRFMYAHTLYNTQTCMLIHNIKYTETWMKIILNLTWSDSGLGIEDQMVLFPICPRSWRPLWQLACLPDKH